MGADVFRVRSACGGHQGLRLWRLVLWGRLVGWGGGKAFVFIRDNNIVLPIGITCCLQSLDGFNRLREVDDSFITTGEGGEDEHAQLQWGSGVYHLWAVIIDDLMGGVGTVGGGWGVGGLGIACHWGVLKNAVVCAVGQ